MAAKSARGKENHPIDTQGKRYFFDISSFDENQVCLSCHPGGGPAEGIVQNDGTVTPYDDPGLTATHTYDRDFYTYDSMDIVKASFADSIADAINDVGEPRQADWNASGIMEADCMLCHIDPDTPLALKCADGLQVFPNRPRMLIFAKREGGEVTEISLGTPLETGLMNQSVLPYTNNLQRMGRPTPKLALMQLPKDMVGEMMQMWMDGLHAIEDANASGVGLPYALYGQNVAKIWDPVTGMLKPEYCANPNGVADEMNRLAANAGALQNLFLGFLDYMRQHGYNITMDQMMGMFFNDFIFAYQIKNADDHSGSMFLPIPLPLRAYEPGNFYTDWDNPNASVRDYVRAPLVEGQGMEYIGRTGLVWNATRYGMGLALEYNDPTYLNDPNDPSKGVNATKVLNEVFDGTLSGIQGELHDYLPAFFGAMASAELMGIDLDQDGSPICYVKLVKDPVSGDWSAKTYWEVDEVTYQSIHRVMGMGGNDANSPKWIKVCGQCHVMTKDDAANIEHARLYNLGMPADWVKNGAFINMTDNATQAGFDVHMSTGQMGCGSCHLKQADFHTTKDLEEMHNFLKGTDTAHMQRNDLDNNYRPKTCERCHLTDKEGLNPLLTMSAHEAKFGHTTAEHLEKIACQTCHVPYKKTWRFRAFDDTLGYYGNFDNAMGYNVLPGGDYSIMAFPPPFAISPVYGTSPGYGIPHFNMNAQHIDANPGAGIRSMDFVSQMVDYFHMTKEGDPGALVNGMPTNPRFDFWKYFYQMNLQMYGFSTSNPDGQYGYDPMWDNKNFPPLYWANGQNGYPQIVIGNPITIMTWVDANATGSANVTGLAYGGAKVLYVRELNAAVKEYQPPRQLVDPMTWGGIAMSMGDNCSGYKDDPRVGKVILKDSGYMICDHTGDMYPDLWSTADVRAMQDALTTVLQAEGVPNPQPMLFMAAHYFSDSHGVQPAEEALGAQSCNDCHTDMNPDGTHAGSPQPGAHRITDRIITFLPWAPAWFTEENRAMVYNGTAMVPTGNNGTDGNGAFFIVDGEVAYIEHVAANGLEILGANASEVLELSEHHARELFYLYGHDEVLGTAIPGVNQIFLTQSEKNETYVNQIANGPDDLLMHVQVPEHLKEALTECGYVQFKQYVDFRAGRNIYGGEAYVFRLGIEDGHFNGETVFAYLPIPEKPLAYQWAWPMLVKQDVDEHGSPDGPWHRVDAGPFACARIVGAFPGYVKVKIYGANGGTGRYAAVWAVLDADADGDGYHASVDCNDGDSSIHPGAIDTPDDGVDQDCTGYDTHTDACGVTDEDPTNDNATCLGCDGVPNSGLVYDVCGVCGGNGSSCMDQCFVDSNGANITDMCGNCVLPEHACSVDCNGDVNGTAYMDNCGMCVGGNTGRTACTQDCAGVWGGDAEVDGCGVCNGDNSTCADLCGVPHGDNSTCADICGVPNGDGTSCLDCNGDANGTAYIDGCGICVGGNTGRFDCVGYTDNATNLQWQSTDSGAFTYDQVFELDADDNNTCDKLVYGGFDDWRMPTRAELQSIYDGNTANHHVNGLDGHVAPYWTSETGTYGQWGVDFDDNTTWEYAGEALYVRCVRDVP